MDWEKVAGAHGSGIRGAEERDAPNPSLSRQQAVLSEGVCNPGGSSEVTREMEPRSTWVPDVWHLGGCGSPSSISGERTPMWSPCRNRVRTTELASLLAMGSNLCLCLTSGSHHFCPLCPVKEIFFFLKASRPLLFNINQADDLKAFTPPQAKKAALLPKMPQSYIIPSSEKVKKVTNNYLLTHSLRKCCFLSLTE